MKRRFHWDEWNLNHIAKHGITRTEAEYIARNAAPPFPRSMDGVKFLIRGAVPSGRVLQVIFVYHGDKDVDYESMLLEDIVTMSDAAAPAIYILHARELTDREKSKYRQAR